MRLRQCQIMNIPVVQKLPNFWVIERGLEGGYYDMFGGKIRGVGMERALWVLRQGILGQIGGDAQ